MVALVVKKDWEVGFTRGIRWGPCVRHREGVYGVRRVWCYCVVMRTRPIAWIGAVGELEGDRDVIVVGRGRRDRVKKEIEVSF